ncbi:MAG: acyl-CoA desaturase [Cyclobacteriaceae bacterium]|nr:acyl-CoA desaturase [Cyclobacteriaceae bacterium]
MTLKTIFMLSLFFVPLIIIISGTVTGPLALFGLYLTSGLGTAGIGMGIMHDAIHGSYSKNKRVNRYLGYTMNLIGANASVWRVQHNILHHTYTNIEEVDEDIMAPSILRFSPHGKRYWIHRYQHIYVWFFYGLFTLSRITTKDFAKLNRYNKMGYFKGKNVYQKEVLKVLGWKLLYYSYALILPLIMVPLAPWLIILAFISMHFLTGFSMSIIFQVAHVMPLNEFPLPGKNKQMENGWATHQLATTCNFSPRNRLFSWLIGGLNYQIEHHLLPNVCHVHYKQLTGIVSKTAHEYGIPYNTKVTFVAAIKDHIKMLHLLGHKDLSPAL